MLEYNVIIGDFNKGTIEKYNIFSHDTFYKYCKKALNKYKDDKEKFTEQIKKELHYYFWSKCEFEVIISHWPTVEGFNDKKIDAYEQVMLNWNIFINYLWENRNKLK